MDDLTLAGLVGIVVLSVLGIVGWTVAFFNGKRAELYRRTCQGRGGEPVCPVCFERRRDHGLL